MKSRYNEITSQADQLQREWEGKRTSPATPPTFRKRGAQWTDPVTFAADRRAHLQQVEAKATAAKVSMTYKDYLRALAAQQSAEVMEKWCTWGC